MARLGLAFCCLWVVYVHAAPGYGGRDSNHGGDSGSTVTNQHKLTSIALPISHINDNGKTHVGYGAGNDGDKGASGGGVSNGDHSSAKENSNDSGRKDAGGRGDDQSSSENGKDGVKEQSGAVKENVNHSSGSGYGSNIGGTNEGNSNFDGNSKDETDRIIVGASEKNSGDHGGYVENSGVEGSGYGSGDKGTNGLKVSNEKIITEGPRVEDSALNVESGNDKSDSGSTNGSSSIYHGGTSDEKSKHQSSLKGGIVDDASFSDISGGGKDSGDKKDYTSSKDGSSGYHSNTGNGKTEQQGSGNEGLDQSSLSASNKGFGDKKHVPSGNHGSKTDAGGYKDSTGNEKAEHQDSSGHGNVHIGENKNQGDKGDGNNGNTDGIGDGKPTLEANNNGGDNNGGGHGNYSSGNHAEKSEGQNTSKPRLEDYKFVSDNKGGYGG